MNSQLTRKPYGLQSYQSFAALPDEIAQYFQYRNRGNFFSSIEWFSCLWQHGYAETPDLLLLSCNGNQRTGEPPYLLCLQEDTRSGRLNSLTNYYTIHYPGISGGTSPPDRVFNAIVSDIRDRRPTWREIELRYLSSTDAETARLESSFSRAGYQVDLFHLYWNWRVNVAGLSYADYLAERPARMRNTLTRKGKKLAAEHTVRFEDYIDADQLAVGLADYLEVYERSWKKPEEQPGFIAELIRLCAKLGVLRLGILYLDHSPVAAQFWICSNETSCIYKLAHDPQYDGYSVGSLLTAHMFEQAIDVDKVAEIDFGVGDEAYKRDWTDSRRQIVGLQAIDRRTLRGSLLSLRLGVRDALRRAGLRQYTPVRLTCPESGDTKIP